MNEYFMTARAIDEDYSVPPMPSWGQGGTLPSQFRGSGRYARQEKQRNQVKSRFYYIFWGIATFSVLAGQLYVGSGYRVYAQSLNRIFDSIEVEVKRPRALDGYEFL
jgi:hypothetical protein